MPDTADYNIKIEQGSGYEEIFQHLDANGDVVPLTTYTGKCQVRYQDGTLACEPTITIYTDTNEWGFKVTSEQTAAIKFNNKVYFDPLLLPFDVLLEQNGYEPWKAMKGFIELSPGVTE